MRTFGAVLLASTLLVSGAFAATDASAPLAPGKPAGVKQAQMQGGTAAIFLGVAIVAGGAALLASGKGNSSVATTTGSTNP